MSERSDFFTWNVINSAERETIKIFLSKADDRIAAAPGKMPFDAKTGHAVVAFLRAMLDRKAERTEPALSPEPRPAARRAGLDRWKGDFQ